MNLLPWVGRLAPAVVLAACAAAPAGIRRDPPVEAREFPEAVLIEGRAKDSRRVAHGCGVLVGPKAVLTVAHLVTGFDAWTVTAPYAAGGPRKQSAHTVHTYPGYRPDDLERDLAVLRLDEPLTVGGELPRLHNGDLLPLETKLVCLGRVANGRLSGDKMYQAPATLASFPGNINLYGGFPAQTESGDSGGPVYRVTRGGREIVGLILGRLGESRANVAIDTLLPVSRKTVAWVRTQSDP